MISSPVIKYLSIIWLFVLSPGAFADDGLYDLSLNVFHEARGESFEGKLLVAMTTLLRVDSPQFPNSISKVVWQKGWSKKHKKYIAQFSWTLDGRPDTPSKKERDKADWEASQYAAKVAYYIWEYKSLGIWDSLVTYYGSPSHYHNKTVHPGWAKKMQLVAKVGHHLFYNQKKSPKAGASPYMKVSMKKASNKT